MHPSILILPPFAYRLCRLLLLTAVLLAPAAACAQADGGAVFPAERLRELREEMDYPLRNKEADAAEEAAREDFGDWLNGLFRLGRQGSIAVFFVLVLLLGFLVYRILDGLELIGDRRRPGDTAADRIEIDAVAEERMVAEGISLSLLERAEQSGQYDVAVRLLYIQSLKELQDAGAIRYRRDYSNADYRRQLDGSVFLGDFEAVTRDYERFWYGKYPLELLSYRLVRRKFTQLSTTVRASLPQQDDFDYA